MTYHKPTEDKPCGLSDDGTKIYTDILQLAAALPKDVVKQVMTDEKSDTPLVLIRESTLMRLYQPVNASEYGAFKAQQQSATYNRMEAGLILPDIPCKVINHDQDSRTNSMIYQKEQ